MLVSSRPWRSVAYLAARLPLPALGALLVLGPIFGGGWTGAAIAVPLALAYLAAATIAAPLDRRLVRLLNRPPIPSAKPRLRTVTHGVINLVLAPFEVTFLIGWLLGGLALVLSPLLISAGPVAAGAWTIDDSGEAWLAAPAGLAVLVAGTYAAIGLAEAHAFLARELLSPTSDELQRQVTELARSRTRIIDAFEVERRRLERDLHDGAQQRLVALAMTLDLARARARRGPGSTPTRLARPRTKASAGRWRSCATSIRGIHPTVLDRPRPRGRRRGARRPLAGARATSTSTCPARLPEAIETAAYFVVAEALANVGKHSGASQARSPGGAPATGTARVRGARRRPRRREGPGTRPRRAGRPGRRRSMARLALDSPHGRADPRAGGDPMRGDRDRRGRALLREGLVAAANARPRGRRRRRRRAGELVERSTEHRPRPRRRRRPDAADVHRRGPARGASRLRRRTRRSAIAGPRQYVEQTYAAELLAPATAAASATCSRTASPTSASSSRAAARRRGRHGRSTPRWSPAARRPARRPARRSSPPVNARCWR